MAISAYCASPPQHARALSLILSALDPKARSLGGLTHELLDIGINSAIACQDEGNAVKFAQLASSLVNASCSSKGRD
jgi:hypothetical protein